jgi:formylglycine-generating enzyme required for sulfatase activity
MRVATIPEITCPRCEAPIRGDFKFCPECACRLKAGPPPAPPAPERGRWKGILLLTAFGLVLLVAGYFVGAEILGAATAPPPVYAPDPAPRRLTAHDIPENLVPIPAGTATYVGESAYVVPSLDRAVERLMDDFGTDGGPALLDAVLAEPERLTRWPRLLASFYERTSDLVEEKLLSVPVETQPFLMMSYEVSRGQYEEFLRAVQQSPDLLTRREEFVRDLWRPTGDASYARYYWDQWWLKVAQYDYRRRQDERLQRLERAGLDPEDEEAEPPVQVRERPAWLEGDGLTDAQAVLLLVPPSWVRLDADGGLTWEMPPGTEDLPVTEICWWDAHMFVVWARDLLGIGTLELPNGAQWMRAFHGDHPRRPPDDFNETGEAGWRWPWGNTADVTGCNNLNFPLNQETPVLRDVRRRYAWHEGRTVDGVLNMAGNAAEWVDNWEAHRGGAGGDGPYLPHTLETHPDGRPILSAYTAGGSFLSGIEDCGLPLNATLNKCAREVQVGFRLVMRAVAAR